MKTATEIERFLWLLFMKVYLKRLFLKLLFESELF